jgi:hypothetical protein
MATQKENTKKREAKTFRHSKAGTRQPISLKKWNIQLSSMDRERKRSDLDMEQLYYKTIIRIKTKRQT